MKKYLFLLFVLVSQIVISQVPDYVPTNGLIGWYPFTNNSNDQSVNANNGINVGAVLTTDRYDNPNSAYQFNGNERIDIPILF